MTTVLMLWTVLGLLSGAIQGSSLWQEASNLRNSGMLAPVRLIGIAGFFGFAAVEGGILAAAAGWAAGLGCTVLWYLLRRTA